jgi:hypothetical protein
VFNRLAQIAAIIRPRAIAQTAARVRLLSNAVSAHDDRLSQVKQQLSALEANMTQLTAQIGNLTEKVEVINRRAEQLVTLEASNARDRVRILRSTRALNAERVQAHVQQAIDRARLSADPFPHIVIDNLLPDDVYEAIVRAIPPRVFFEDRPVNKQQLTVPFHFAPEYSRHVWDFVAKSIAREAIGPALIDKFTDPILAFIQSACPLVTSLDNGLSMHVSDGRILLRRPGYVIPPHRDPKWGFMTCLMYLVRPGDDESYGTQLYGLQADGEAPTVAPFWVDGRSCILKKTVPFRANTALAFLNSAGAHGASIPPDAPTPVERYIYQFRVGPDPAGIEWLLSKMPPDVRSKWAGKRGEYG